jgi:hypothetical protein
MNGKMENSRKSYKEYEQQKEQFYLPDFFKKEFPNLTKFIYEKLLKEYYRN